MDIYNVRDLLDVYNIVRNDIFICVIASLKSKSIENNKKKTTRKNNRIKYNNEQFT